MKPKKNLTANSMLLICLLVICFVAVPAVVNAQNPEYVSSVLWAGMEDVVIAGDYACCATTNGLMIIDFSDFAEPAYVSKVYFQTGASDVCASADNAYVFLAIGSDGLGVVDISDPNNPFIIGTYNADDWVSSIYLSENYVYLAAGQAGLKIFDISDPANPSLVGGCFSLFGASGVVVSGNYAYLADGMAGITVVDVSDPTSPTIVGNYDSPSWAHDVCVSGDYAYLACGMSGVYVIDISDPTNPTVGSIVDTDGFAWALDVSGNNLYIADYESGTQIADISDPATPSIVSNYPVYFYRAWGVYAIMDFVCVSDISSGLQIIDASDPANPTLASEYDMHGEVKDSYVSGDYLYVADMGFGLQIFDVTDPANPVFSGEFLAPTDVWGVTVSGNYAYVAASTSGMYIIDISDPSNPTQVGSYDTPDVARNIDVSGDYAYVADKESGLQVIDISDPSNPFFVAEQDTPGWADKVQINGNYAYVADETSLEIIDVSDPLHPTLASSYTPPDMGWAFDVSVSNGYAYLSDMFGGFIYIVDVSDPFNPTTALSYEYEYPPNAVTAYGNHLYVGGWGVQIFDISDPTNLLIVGECAAPGGRAQSVFISGEYIYLSNYSSMVIFSGAAAPSGENDILSFTIPEQIGDTVIDDVGYTVQLDVPSGTNITALIPTIEISNSAIIDPASGTPQDFTDPFEYTVTAQNGEEQIWIVTVTLVVSADNLLLTTTELIGNYPNPFNPITTISFTLPAEFNENIKLTIFNLKGQKVKTFLINSSTYQPINSVIWYGTDEHNNPVSSGVYLYQLKAGNFSETKRMLLLK
jgi:hypothetical protein